MSESGLMTVVPPRNPETGAIGPSYQKIEPGLEATVVKEDKVNGMFDFLDDIGEKLEDGVTSIFNAAVDKEVNKFQPHSGETKPDSTGDIMDQPRTVATPEPMPSFLEKNKKNLMIGGAVLAAIGVVYWVTR